MHVIVALSPICTVVFLGRLVCKMGRDRGLAVEKMMEMYFQFQAVTIPKVSVVHGAETRQIKSCFTL